MVACSSHAGVAISEAAIAQNPKIELVGWDDTGLSLLRRMNTAGQKLHLGGPESEEKLLDRHSRYLTYHLPADTEMLRISADGRIAGSIGYWQIERNGSEAYETGWEVLTEFHGRGIGSTAARQLMQRLKPIARHQFVFAFPTPDNIGSNGICRRLGFELLGAEDFEYPKGTVSPHHVWRLDLSSFAPPA